jgi:PKD repeat protein
MLVAVVLLAVAAAPASASAMTRAQAAKRALVALHPERSKGQAVVFGLPKPLARGSEVLEAGPGPATRGATKTATGKITIKLPHRPLRAKAWLFWEDLAPGALFEHPSVMVLVDDRSGKVVRRQNMAWWPIVNGRRPAFLKSLDAYYAPTYRIYGKLAAAAATAPSRALARVADVTGPPNLASDCMVTIGYREDPLFAGDFKLAGQIAAELKIPKYDATDALDLEAKIGKAQARGCKDVMIVIAAHGFPAQGSNYRSSPGAGTITESAHAQVSLKYAVTDSASGTRQVFDTLDATQVRAIMGRFPALSFKLVVSACFSGRWLELNDVRNLRVIAVGARRDQFGFGWAPETAPNGVYYAYPKQSQTGAVITPTGGKLENHVVNTTHATTFMNGIMRGLDAWAHSDGDRAKTGDDLAKGISAAFSHAKDYDFSAQSGSTNPQLGDYSDRMQPTVGVSGPGSGSIPVNKAPTASFTWDPNAPPAHPKAGETILFSGTASDPDGTIAAWEYDFGDTTTAHGVGAPSTVHGYANPGVYQVTLKVTDDDGATFVTDPQTVYVSGPGTKVAVLDDVPCPTATSSVDADVLLRIPSYAQNPTATFSNFTCPGGASATIVSAVVESGNDEGLTDEWGRQKNTLHVKLHLTGASSGVAAMTVTAHWQ